MNYYFLPKSQVCDKNQIQGSIGVDPSVTDKEVLNYLGVYEIIEWGGERNIFFSPDSDYEIKGGLAYQKPSQLPLPLEEAKVKASQLTLELCKYKIEALIESSGLPKEFLHIETVEEFPLLKHLKNSVREEALLLRDKLNAIEKVTSIEDLEKLFLQG